MSSAPATSIPTGKDEVITVYEEQLSVGKRDINHGRVRVRSYVVEKPVSDRVNLRNECFAPLTSRPHGISGTAFDRRSFSLLGGAP